MFSLGDYEWIWNKPLLEDFYVSKIFKSVSWYLETHTIATQYYQVMFSLWETACLQKRLHHFKLQTVLKECFCCYTSSPTISIVSFCFPLYFNYYNRHSELLILVHNDMMLSNFFWMLICHLYSYLVSESCCFL
jgi:hypothetical protein